MEKEIMKLLVKFVETNEYMFQGVDYIEIHRVELAEGNIFRIDMEDGEVHYVEVVDTKGILKGGV